MAELKVITDVTSYRKQVQTYAKLTGVDLRTAMRESVSVMAGQLARRFPPKTAKQGKDAIQNDLNRVFDTDEAIIKEWEQSIESGVMGSSQTMRAFKTKSGAVFLRDEAFYRPNASLGEMEQHHLRQRSPATGRVTTAGGYTRNIGRWKAVDKMYVRAPVLKSYVALVANGVGRLKAGWSPATTMWKGAAKLPSWITRHANDYGSVNDQMKASGDGYIEIVNETPYASRWSNINAFVVKSQSRMFSHRIRAVFKKRNAELSRSKSA
jgi:hypothetical protein